jgi:hypothetical protein
MRFATFIFVLGQILASVAVVSLLPCAASALLGTEDQVMQIEINLAKARAQDFHNYLNKKAAEKALAALAAEQMRLSRRLERQKRNEMRENVVVVEHHQRAVNEERQNRLEAENDLDKKRELAQMERNRQVYVLKRRRVRDIIEHEATIDEYIEYELPHTRPGS